MSLSRESNLFYLAILVNDTYLQSNPVMAIYPFTLKLIDYDSITIFFVFEGIGSDFLIDQNLLLWQYDYEYSNGNGTADGDVIMLHYKNRPGNLHLQFKTKGIYSFSYKRLN